MTNGTTALFVATPPSGGDGSHGCPIPRHRLGRQSMTTGNCPP